MNLTEIEQQLKQLCVKFDELSKVVGKEKQREKMFGEWLSEEDVIAATGLSRGTLFKLYKEGKVGRSKLSGKRNYYRLSDFRMLLDKNENKE